MTGERKVGVVSKDRTRQVRLVEVVTGGISGVTAVALMLGIAIARLTTSTRHSAEMVIAGVAIAGGLVGGFAVAPCLNVLARSVHRGTRNEDVDHSSDDAMSRVAGA